MLKALRFSFRLGLIISTMLVSLMHSSLSLGSLVPDPSFKAGTGVNSSANPQVGTINGDVNTIIPLTNGEVLIGGLFTSVHNAQEAYFARLESDGEVNSPSSTVSFSQRVRAIAEQIDGKVLVAGDFGSHKIVRLDQNGVLDTSFNSPINMASNIFGVHAIHLQLDGKILLGGLFTVTVGATDYHNLIRLNVDGSVDTTFVAYTDAGNSGIVTSFGKQSDGKIIIGGFFTNVNGTSASKIARINTDGSLDTSFNSPTLFLNGGAISISSIGIQRDDKIILSGVFTGVSGLSRRGIARLNIDGSIDTSFINVDPDVLAVNRIVLQANGKIIMAGGFQVVQNVVNPRLTRLNSNGTVDVSFESANSNLGFNDPVRSINLQRNGKILAGGKMVSYQGAVHSKAIRMQTNDAITNTFQIDSSQQLIKWIRDGQIAQLHSVMFQESSNENGPWLSLGEGGKTSLGWEYSGQNIPTSGFVRAVGYHSNGRTQAVDFSDVVKIDSETCFPIKAKNNALALICL